ncbi:MAG: 50S ribosomal protein L30 [Candidatus Altiarchaeota archaeon]|nr:50S ribosomal protein L30 [Candidatus Altiarchaeota archaeon]
MADKKRLAVLRVRGKVHVRSDIEETLRLLNLNRVNHCVIIDDRKEYAGMINKVKDYVTWGEIAPELIEKILETRGQVTGGEGLTDAYMKKNSKYKSVKKFSDDYMKFKTEIKEITGLKPVFRLNPPKKGYERKGIKHPYSIGGALGYRGGKINELLDSML